MQINNSSVIRIMVGKFPTANPATVKMLKIMFLFQVGWRITVQWIAGNFACKAFLFLRAFGLYLSSNVLVCVSLDRYFAVLHPLRVTDARRRGKVMLAYAWGVSLIYAVPQVNVLQSPTRHHFYPRTQTLSLKIDFPLAERRIPRFPTSCVQEIPTVCFFRIFHFRWPRDSIQLILCRRYVLYSFVGDRCGVHGNHVRNFE